MEMTKKDYVDIIWDWAYDNLEFDVEKGFIQMFRENSLLYLGGR